MSFWEHSGALNKGSLMGIFGSQDMRDYADFIVDCFAGSSAAHYFGDARFAEFMEGIVDKPNARAMQQFQQITGYSLDVCQVAVLTASKIAKRSAE